MKTIKIIFSVVETNENCTLLNIVEKVEEYLFRKGHNLLSVHLQDEVAIADIESVVQKICKILKDEHETVDVRYHRGKVCWENIMTNKSDLKVYEAVYYIYSE